MNNIKAYPLNSHMNYYTTEGWVYLGQFETSINNMGVIDMYVNHKKQWTSYVYSNDPSCYISGDYERLFKDNTWLLNESGFRDIHKEFLRRCGVNELIG